MLSQIVFQEQPDPNCQQPLLPTRKLTEVKQKSLSLCGINPLMQRPESMLIRGLDAPTKQTSLKLKRKIGQLEE